jgi:pyochelin biosynthetic protein PchC
MTEHAKFDARRLRLRGSGHERVIVCFHHAGGGMSAFRGWAEAFAVCADVALVQLEGREDRLGELRPADLAGYTAEIARDLCGLAYREIVLFGHSMGATVAWATADAIWILYRRRVRLVVSAQAAPSRLRRMTGERWAEHEALVNEVAESGPLDKEGLASVAGETLAADLQWMGVAFTGTPDRVLPIDIHCISADDDRVAPPASVADWARHTSGTFSHTTVRGGHMYLLTAPTAAQDILKSIVIGSSTSNEVTDAA